MTTDIWNILVSRLRQIACDHPRVAVASSLAAEDMVLTHAILSQNIPISIFTLDTGRLHAETLAVIRQIQVHYGYDIEIWKPEQSAVAQHVSLHGDYGFYESIDLRKACCHLRKIEPLKRALTGRGAWITGQRREQSVTRMDVPLHEQDAVFGLDKYNPLAFWRHADVWRMIRQFRIPYNALHDQGYPSIGCEPCTRAVKPGEDLRAGRWWWESAQSRECGLHSGQSLSPIIHLQEE